MDAKLPIHPRFLRDRMRSGGVPLLQGRSGAQKTNMGGTFR